MKKSAQIIGSFVKFESEVNAILEEYKKKGDELISLAEDILKQLENISVELIKEASQELEQSKIIKEQTLKEKYEEEEKKILAEMEEKGRANLDKAVERIVETFLGEYA